MEVITWDKNDNHKNDDNHDSNHKYGKRHNNDATRHGDFLYFSYMNFTMLYLIPLMV